MKTKLVEIVKGVNRGKKANVVFEAEDGSHLKVTLIDGNPSLEIYYDIGEVMFIEE